MTYLADPKSVRIVCGPPLDPDTQAQLIHASILLKKAFDDLDSRVLEKHLAEDVVYESQAVVKPISGCAALIEFFDAKFDTIRQQQEVTARAVLELGTVDLPVAKDYPVLICSYSGERKALFQVSLGKDLKICRIDVLVSVPNPKAATRLRLN